MLRNFEVVAERHLRFARVASMFVMPTRVHLAESQVGCLAELEFQRLVLMCEHGLWSDWKQKHQGGFLCFLTGH